MPKRFAFALRLRCATLLLLAATPAALAGAQSTRADTTERRPRDHSAELGPTSPMADREWESTLRRRRELVGETGARLGTHDAGPRPPAAVRAGPPVPARASSGSGVVVGANGAVVTNYHVVRGCVTLRARVGGGPPRAVRLAGVDSGADLALLRLPGASPPPVRLRGGTAVRPGEPVVAVGYPLTGILADEVNVTTGAVSALAGPGGNRAVLQMTAPVQPGNSGGPLLDASGHLVGVVVAKLDAVRVAAATGDIPQNVNFAVKAPVVQAFLASHGVRVTPAVAGAPMGSADVGDVGRRSTVQVLCSR